MAITRTATARYEGTGKDGRGSITTQSNVLHDQHYGFHTRFEDGPGTNPEELIAAAHAACFTMALSFALAKEGFTQAQLRTTARVRLEQDGAAFTVSRSDLELTADVRDIGEDRLRELANNAKVNCPISRLLNAEMDLTIGFAADAAS